MKAISIIPGKAGAAIVDVTEPEIRSPHQVKIRVAEVGICGTDREEVTGGRADAPPGSNRLIIGHEMIGSVVEKGAQVSKVDVGDWVIVTVRRGCGHCEACSNGRSDLCYTGDYTERGIKRLHGFEAEYVVDEESNIIKVPDSIRHIGVLAEPMSIAQKAIHEAVNLQLARMGNIEGKHWMNGKKAVVAGIGAVGLLAAVALRLRGVAVTGIDVVDEETGRPAILKALGGDYWNARKMKIQKLSDSLGQIDFIFEAAGVPQLGFGLIDVLGINGIYVMTGIPGEGKPICFPAAETMAGMVLKNQIIYGSVNASPAHFEMGIRDMEHANVKWPGLMEQLITTRISFREFEKAINLRDADDIKTVVSWEDMSDKGTNK